MLNLLKYRLRNSLSCGLSKKTCSNPKFVNRPIVLAGCLQMNLSSLGAPAGYSKAQIIEALQQEVCDATYRISLTDFTVRRLAPDVMLVTYRTTIQDQSQSRLRSSIWKVISGHWQMVFHQGTPS